MNNCPRCAYNALDRETRHPAGYARKVTTTADGRTYSEAIPIYGNVNDPELTPEHHLTASEQMGAKLCQLFGLDPSRFSASYLRGAAQAAAGILGKHYAGPGYDAAKWELVKAEHRHASPCADLDVFLRATREVA